MLFSAIFSDQVDCIREHIEHEDQLLVHNQWQGISPNTRSAYQLQVQTQDYKTASALNDAANEGALQQYRLLLCANTHPLSMHNNAKHIDEEVLSNCPFATQQKFRDKTLSDTYVETEQVQQSPSILHDIIEKVQQMM